MKSNLFRKGSSIFLLLLFYCISNAQVATKYTYTPNAVSAAYSLLSSGQTTIVSGNGANTSNAWYQGGAANTSGSGIPIGFTFQFNCISYTSIGVHTNGFIWFGTGNPSTTGIAPISDASANLGGSGTIDGLVAGYSGSAAATPRIPISASAAIRYRVDGSLPNRIFKIEWAAYKMTGLSNGSGTTPSTQIWLYETSNNIEFYINNMQSIAISGTRLGQLGIRGASNADFKNCAFTTTSSWSNIPAGTLNTQTVQTSSSPQCWPNPNRMVAWTFTGSCCTPPSTQASMGSFSNLSTSSVQVNWARGNGTGGVVVVAHATSAVSANPANGTDYTAGQNALFGSGTNLGSSNFVVYAGTGTSVNVTGLTGGTTYFFSVFEYNTTALCYLTPGSSGSQPIPTCFPPSVAASGINFSNLTTTTKDVNWTRGNGDAGVIVVARLSTSVNTAPTNGISYTANAAFGSGSQLGTGNYVVYQGTGTTVNVSNLLPSSNYVYSVYEYNAAGTCYASATTGNQTTASCSPSTDASALAFTNVLPNTLTLSFTRGSGTNVLVVARLTATANVAPVYNTAYAANPNFGSGSTTGANNFVVFNGTGNTVNITGLASASAYTFLVYEYNASPNCYSISPASASVTTLDGTAPGGTPALSCQYTFSGTTGFSTITGAVGKVLIASGSIDDVIYPAQNINAMTNGSGFTFTYAGTDYTSFGISSNGYIWFGTGSPAINTYNPIGNASANLGGSGSITGVIAAAGTDLINHGHISSLPNPAQINTVVTGVAPNRILTIEWTGFVAKSVVYSCFNALSTFTDESRLDFQIKLYEKGGTVGNRIEMAYRDQNPFCVNDAYTFQAGLRGTSNAEFLNRSQTTGSMTAASTTNGGAASSTIALSTTFINGNILFRFDNTLPLPTISGSAVNICPATTTTLTSSSAVNNQWFLNGSIIPGPGSNLQNYVASVSGLYTVRTNTGTCYATSSPLTVTISSCGVAPQITSCPGNVSVNNDSSLCTAIANYAAATASGVPAPVITYSQNSGTVFNGGATTVTVTATNASGVATCTFTVTVTDAEVPLISCPASINLIADTGLCTSASSIGTATATDNCAGAMVTHSPAGPYPVGSTTVTWTATDAGNNTTTCTQIVNVADNEDPVISCPLPANLNTDPGSCNSTLGIGTAAVTDNCSIASVTLSPPGPYPIGNTMVTWTATDVNGRTATCTQQVVVTDAENPVFQNCPGNMVSCSQVVMYTPPTATDNCGSAGVICSPPSGSTFPVGVTTVNCVATDSSGNTSTCSFTVTVYSNPTVTINFTNVTCNGAGNGTMTAIVANGTPGYSYAWDNGSTNASRTSLLPLTYTITVSDINGCTATASHTIGQPDVLVATGSSGNIVCRGINTGSITMAPSGGTSPYSYLWNNGSTQQNRSLLATGTYTVTVTDANGCTKTKSSTITQPATTLLINISQTNLRCFGLASGIAGVTPAGGTSPYSFSWNTFPVQTTASISGLAAGAYTCTITDAIGCTKTQVIAITQPPDISVFQTQTNVTFPGGNNGTATVSVTGGVPGYTYAWNTIPVKTTATATGLTAGTYKCTITDSKNCPKKVTFIITEPISRQGDNNIAPDWNFRAYPNPASGLVTISFNSPRSEKINLTMTDFTGRIIYQHESQSTAGLNEVMYDFGAYAKGVYFIKISANETTQTMRVVIQ